MTRAVISDYDLYLFHEGNHFFSYNILGSHLVKENHVDGVRFVVWAPNANDVQVVGNFNNWNGNEHKMNKFSTNGIWSLFIPNLTVGEVYKYKLFKKNGTSFLKADPYARYAELRPNTASIVYSMKKFQWNDDEWYVSKQNKNSLNQPINIYEMHFGSWKKKDGEFFTYRELADELIDYVLNLGFTHIEILPIMEHPYDRSWGYQITGLYAVTSRYGEPEDFKYFVEQCHQKGIGVLLDWIPAHFAKDAHGLRQFDGTSLYEYDDPNRSESEWGSLCFDLGSNEVTSFLISNAMYWLDEFHIDGLRVDAVSSILYLDFGKEEGTWTPNKYGGRENLDAIHFLKKLNEVMFEHHPEVLMIAEESTAWPQVTAPTYLNGLGFNLKWNMGWMNDVLKYMEIDPIHRKYHHHLLTFSFFYAFSENFILALSHDEVVHGKKSLLNKMPGDYWQKFANLRVLFGYMYTHPGKKTLFMGAELAQFDEWKDEEQLDWNLLDFDMHKNLSNYVKQLNLLYKQEPSLWELDSSSNGFSWIDPSNHDQSIITFLRKNEEEHVVIVCNFTPMTYSNYRIGVPQYSSYREIINSDNRQFGGSGIGNDIVFASNHSWHNQPYHVEINVPPLAMVILKEKEQLTKGGRNES
ncbi:1,4-alpha-glucan branching protein GlgB [Aquibacillus rhizosphaerae]|uniref:1,4-alpha-glucan branching enzyme GlgB n=1 Tax=Aquibacillus rhizosphaerae TaxID=3051431 RepID=A0ABT7L1B6_9BACI|nr:1,4-alpha-glucan branching protein GlgB [Aquibacillus sp. LR5S19]MDL4839636.1 1,4-alpha-glucan branching protein GlgB [Aquibacillus sp. LR5S19]